MNTSDRPKSRNPLIFYGIIQLTTVNIPFCSRYIEPVGMSKSQLPCAMFSLHSLGNSYMPASWLNPNDLCMSNLITRHDGIDRSIYVCPLRGLGSQSRGARFVCCQVQHLMHSLGFTSTTYGVVYFSCRAQRTNAATHYDSAHVMLYLIAVDSVDTFVRRWCVLLLNMWKQYFFRAVLFDSNYNIRLHDDWGGSQANLCKDTSINQKFDKKVIEYFKVHNPNRM